MPEALGEPLDASQQTAIRHLFSLDTVRTLEQRSNDHDVLLALSGRVRQRLGVESFWARVMDGLLFIDEDHWDYQAKQKISIEMVSLRNREMGQNVLWLLEQHPNEKLILSLASVHASRTHAGLEVAKHLPKHHDDNGLARVLSHITPRAPRTPPSRPSATWLVAPSTRWRAHTRTMATQRLGELRPTTMAAFHTRTPGSSPCGPAWLF